MNFCSNCGAAATGSAYCGNCGAPMTAAAATRATGQSQAGRAASRPGAPGEARDNPFADIPALDYGRDVIALVLLLVSFGMPWDLEDSVTGKVYVVLVTLLSILSLALPYLQRAGVLSTSWGTAELRLARLAANAPYVVVVLITLVLGYVGDNGGDGVGVGIAFGLAGALLAAQGRAAEQTSSDGGDGALWRWITLGIGALFALLTIVSLITFLTDDAEALEWDVVTYLVVSMLFFLALAALPLWGVFRGDAGWRDVFLLLGVVALFVSVWQLSAEGTMADAWRLSTFGPQLILVPALAAAAAAPGLQRRYTAPSGAAYWPAVGIRMLQLVMVAAGAGVVFYALQIIGSDIGRGVNIVVLVLALILVLAALVGRNALVRDANAGRAIAIVAGGVFILLGIVIAAILGAADETIVAVVDATIISVLWWFGVALFVVLTAPSSVRSEYGPVGASQLSFSSVLPGGGGDSTDDTATTVRPARTETAAAAATAGKPAGAKADDAKTDVTKPGADKDKPSDDVPASPAVPASEAQTVVAPAAGVPATDEPAGRIGNDRPGPVSGLSRNESNADDTATRVDQPVVSDSESGSSGFDAQTALDPNTPLQVLADIAAQEPGLRKHVAANPSTYPELLTWLSQLGDPEVDEALRRR